MTCGACGGLIAEPGVAYGWAGKWCHCHQTHYAPNPPAKAPGTFTAPPLTEDDIRRIIREELKGQQ